MIAEDLEQRSYVPYSGNPEFAMVKSRSGKYFPGIRIENISFPLTIPATLCGIATCLSEGEQPAVIYLSEPRISDPRVDYWVTELNIEVADLSKCNGEAQSPYMAVHNLRETLEELLQQAITPHSSFPVATLLETDRGYISGVNIEFDAWEAGLCAERTAIAKALACGVDQSEIKTMHLHTRHGDYSSPCGACRQVIIEHMPHIPIFLYHPNGTVSRHFSSDLLPYSFKSDFLKRNI